MSATDQTFDDSEIAYCISLVSRMGDGNVGRDPKTIATYLRVQASRAFGRLDYESAARLGQAATAINCDARNDHAPDWRRAIMALTARADDNVAMLSQESVA